MILREKMEKRNKNLEEVCINRNNYQHVICYSYIPLIKSKAPNPRATYVTGCKRKKEKIRIQEEFLQK